MLRILCLLLLSAIPTFGQSSTPPVTVATLNDLLARAPRANESALVLRGYNGQDWGDGRVFTQTTSSALTTNVAHVFAITNIYGAQGQWLSADRTNAVQDIRWWRGGPQAADNTAPLTNAANYVSNLGGGYIKAGAGTHTFLAGGINMPSGVRFIGVGADATVFDFTAATPVYDYEPVISWVGTVDNTVKLYSVPTVGDRTIVLSSSVSWANGDWIQLSDTNAFSFGSRNYYKQGEFNFVYSNTGGTNIVLLEPLEAAYPTATTTINKITPTVGSAEGIHFALGTKSGAVRLAYADNRSYLKDCSAAGTEEAHFWVDNCYGVSVSGLTVDWDSDPSVGLNYGLVYGDSEYLQIGPGNFFRSARHGIASGGSSIPTRYCRVFNSTFGSTRQNVAGADMHGDVVESTFENCTFLSGLTLGGGRNRVINSTIMNGRGATGVAVGECYYYDWEVRGNRFLISSFDDEAQSVWAMRFTLQAGSQAGQPASTNYWPGTWGGTSGQSIKILDNEIQFTGVRTNGNYAIFIDESSTLAANTNLTAADFGGVFIRGNRIIPSADQAFAQITAPGVYIETRDKVRWSAVDISDNPWIQAAGTQVRVHSGKVLFNRNTVVDQNTGEGVYIIPTVPMASPVDFEAIDNLFLRPIGSALTASSTTGRVLYRGNRIFNHGSINSSLSRFALVASDGSSSVSAVELGRNYITSTNSPTYDVYVTTTAGSLREEYTELGGSVSTGTRSVGGGYLRAPFLANAYGSTNAIALLGQYTALPTAGSYPPGLAHSAGDLWYSDGVSWSQISKYTTNFPNLYVTNTVNAKDIAAETVSIGPSRTVFAILSDPLYVFHNTNGPLRMAVQNNNTGSTAQAGMSLTTGGSTGTLMMRSPNDSTAALTNRLVLDGPRLGFDIDSGADVQFMVAGSPFATLTETLLTVPSLTSTFATNVGTHVLTVTGTGSRKAGSMTLTDLKNAMGTSSSTNLDNLTVTNTVRFGGNFTISDTIGGTDRFTLTGTGINSFMQFASFGDLLVGSAAGIYASSTNNWFYNGLNQYWPGTSDRVWLTSLGFKNATPLRGANILDSTTIDWTTSGTNVTPSIKSQSLSTNLIDSTFYSLLMMTNTGGSGSTSTNYLVKALVQNAVALTVADTTLSETNMITTQPSWGVTNFAAGYWTTNNALHVEASGTFTAPGNWSGGTFKVKLGSYVLSATFEETDSLLPTDQAWRLVADIKVQTPGTNATVMGTGSLAYYYGSPGGSVSSGLAVAAASGTLNTTVQNTLSVTFDNDDSQPLTLKMASLFANELGAEVLTSGGVSSLNASLVSVNGATNNWNFNSTTPTAPTGYEAVTLSGSGTNVIMYVPARKIFTTTATTVIGTSSPTQVWTNQIPAGLLSAGDVLRFSQSLVWTNGTGSTASFTPRFFFGTNDISDSLPATAISATTPSAGSASFVVDVVNTNSWNVRVTMERASPGTLGPIVGDLGTASAFYTWVGTNITVVPTAGIPIAFWIQLSTSDARFGVTAHQGTLLRN